MWFQWLGMIGMVLLTGEFAVDFIMRMSGSDCYYGLETFSSLRMTHPSL